MVTGAAPGSAPDVAEEGGDRETGSADSGPAGWMAFGMASIVPVAQAPDGVLPPEPEGAAAAQVPSPSMPGQMLSSEALQPSSITFQQRPGFQQVLDLQQVPGPQQMVDLRQVPDARQLPGSMTPSAVAAPQQSLVDAASLGTLPIAEVPAVKEAGLAKAERPAIPVPLQPGPVEAPDMALLPALGPNSDLATMQLPPTGDAADLPPGGNVLPAAMPTADGAEAPVVGQRTSTERGTGTPVAPIATTLMGPTVEETPQAQPSPVDKAVASMPAASPSATSGVLQAVAAGQPLVPNARPSSSPTPGEKIERRPGTAERLVSIGAEQPTSTAPEQPFVSAPAEARAGIDPGDPDGGTQTEGQATPSPMLHAEAPGRQSPSEELLAPRLDRAGPASATAEPAPRLPTYPTEPSAPTVQVSAAIAKAANGSVERVHVALEPKELGSIEITISTNDANETRAVIKAEKPETLDLLQRDHRQLERLIGNAGLKLEGGGLEFSLQRDQGQGAAFAHAQARPHRLGRRPPGDDEPMAAEAPRRLKPGLKLLDVLI